MKEIVFEALGYDGRFVGLLLKYEYPNYYIACGKLGGVVRFNRSDIYIFRPALRTVVV